MLGYTFVVFGAAILVIVISVDIIHATLPTSRAGRFGRSISESPNVNLAAYALSLLMIYVGLPLEAQQTQNPFLLDAFPISFRTILFYAMVIMPLLFLNITRYERFGLAERHREGIYALAEELIGEQESPDEGVQAAIDYVRNNSRMHRLVSVEGFLNRLVTRGGSVALIAAKNLSDLGDPV